MYERRTFVAGSMGEKGCAAPHADTATECVQALARCLYASLSVESKSGNADNAK